MSDPAVDPIVEPVESVEPIIEQDLENLTDEQKSYYETHKMFNLAEKAIMEYFCYYLEQKPDQLFADVENLNIKSDELVLYPLEGFEDMGCLYFGLELVPYDYKTAITKELLNNQYVHDAVQFLQHSIREVFQAILHTSFKKEVNDKVLAASFHLEFDEPTLTFKPVYVYAPKRQMNILNYCKDNLQKFYEDHQHNNTWESLEEEIKEQWKAQYSQVISILENIFYSPAEADKKEKEINAKLKTANRIGITFHSQK